MVKKVRLNKLTFVHTAIYALFGLGLSICAPGSATASTSSIIIDAESGEIIAAALNENNIKRIDYNKALLKKIENRNLITVHTHPHSFPPSINDFNSAFKHGYNLCLVICHDGKVFKYGAYEECYEDLYLIKLASFIQDGYNDYEAQVMTLNYMALFFNIWFEEV